MKTKLLLFLSFILISLSQNSFSQEGSIDTSFNIGTGFNDTVNNIVIQPDGKIVVCGSFTSYNGVARFGIARLNTDGSLDTNFVPPLPSFYTLSIEPTIDNLKIQPDGKIVYSNFAGANLNERLLRLNADGSHDTSFNIQPNNSIQDYYINTDGSFIIVGNFTSVNGVPKQNIVKTTSTGVIDPTFNIGAGFFNSLGPSFGSTVIRTVDGKYLIGGTFTSYNGYTSQNFIALDNSGDIDVTFNNPSFENAVRGIKELSDGKIIVFGDFLNVNGYSFPRVVKLNSNGTLNANFAFQSDGRPNGIDVQPDGKIINAGLFTTIDGVSRNCIARHKTDLSLDATFQVGTGFNGWAKDTKVQADGKIIVVGEFTEYNGTIVNKIIRLNNATITNPTHCYEFTGTLNGSSIINPNGRIFTNDINATCEVPKVYPGSAPGMFDVYYNTYTITNTSGAAECVTFTLTNPNPEWIQMSVYQNIYNPENFAQNYLGGIGANVTNSITNHETYSMSLNVPNGTTLVIVVNTNSEIDLMTGNYTLKIDGLCNTPSVRVTPLSFLDGATTSKPVLYYNVNFIQPVDGFSANNIVINGGTGANTVYIVPTSLNPSNNKDYVIGITGMRLDSFVAPTFLPNAVTSLSLGIPNLPSINTSISNINSNTIEYLQPNDICAFSGIASVPKSALYNFVQAKPNSTCGFEVFTASTPANQNTRIHQFVNSTATDKCIGVKISKTGTTAPRFVILKNNIPTTTLDYITNYIGSSNENPNIASMYSGIAAKAGYANVQAGQTFYVEVETTDTNYNLTLEEIPCGQVLATDDFVNDNKIKVYPNPSNGIFNIQTTENINKIAVYNTLGQKVLEGNTLTIDLTNQPSGIYFAELVSSQGKSIQKIIKQ